MNGSPPFGRWLRERRESLDMTREDLAEKVSCARVTIAKIEHGERRPSRQVAERLAESLDLPPEQHAAFLRWARGMAVVPGLPGIASDGEPAEEKAIASPVESQDPATPPADHLPASPTSFIGREREVATLLDRLRNEGVRLLTLTGPPGIGKTRLSVAVAAGLRGEFQDGVWFVPLAPLTDPDLVVPTIATVLGLKESPGQGAEVGLQAFLRDKRLLLVLDNFEQVTDAAPALGRLLAAAPHMKLLVTSRAVLHLYGEQEYSVPPLELPDAGHPFSAASPRYASVELFVQRAQAARPDFSLNPQNYKAVAQICVKLDGLPLAIELAAARSKLFTPEALLARLEQRLTFLTGGPVDRESRQRTLMDAIAWSYSLLDDSERGLFRWLGVFVGGCTLEAVESISEVGDDHEGKAYEQKDALDTLELLGSLADKSLLRREEAGGELRFSMLETIREYALHRLAECEEADLVRRKHAGYFLRLAEMAEPHLRGPRQVSWLEQLEVEHDNMRAALSWLLQVGDVDAALRLAGALSLFWSLRGHLTEGRHWVDTVLARADSANPSLARARALYHAGRMDCERGEYAQAERLFTESLALCRHLGDGKGIAYALLGLGMTARWQGHYEQAVAYERESLTESLRVGEKWCSARAFNQLGVVLGTDLGEYEQGRAALKEGLTLFTELEDQWGIAATLNNLGVVVGRGMSEYGVAVPWLKESLACFRGLGDKLTSLYPLINLGVIAVRQGEPGHAAALFEEALSLSRELNRKYAIAQCLEGIARVAAERHEAEKVAILLGAAEGVRASVGNHLEHLDRLENERAIEAIKGRISDEAYGLAWKRGRAMSLEEATSVGLEVAAQAASVR
ncbi:MAG TPA: tetratricopeptide repeat protein [Chloroflexia bacterium]